MFNIFKTRVSIHVGDPLEAEAQGLVIPANDHLWMGSGIGGSLKKKGGEEIEVEAVKQGPAVLGQAVTTPAGNLPFERIYHAVVAGQDLKTVHEKIDPALGAALSSAGRDGLERLAIAPLEDEDNLGAFHDASRHVVRALLQSLNDRNTPLRAVVLTVHGEEARHAYREALLSGLGAGS